MVKVFSLGPSPLWPIHVYISMAHFIYATPNHSFFALPPTLSPLSQSNVRGFLPNILLKLDVDPSMLFNNILPLIFDKQLLRLPLFNDSYALHNLALWWFTLHFYLFYVKCNLGQFTVPSGLHRCSTYCLHL